MITTKSCLGLMIFALLTGVSSIPAYADCAPEIAAAEKERDGQAGMKPSLRNIINNMIEKAKKAENEAFMKNAKKYSSPPEIELTKGEEPQFRVVDGIGCDLTGEPGIECSLIKPLHTPLWDLH